MTPPPSVPGAGTTGSPTDGKIGAFEAPKAAPVAAAGQSPAKPQTEHVSVNVGSGQAKAAPKPVEVPKVEWKSPVTAVQAKPEAKGGERAIVTFVPDGDTADVKRKGGDTIRCRIDSIDAPETAKPQHGKAGQPYGEEAGALLRNMILKQEVTLRVTKPVAKGTNYDRALCQIEIQGQNIDREMIKAGAAWLYRRYNKDPELIELENAARKSKKGLWADPNPIEPEKFRRLQELGR